jgi:hypothetical protein
MTRLGELRKEYKAKFGKGAAPKWDEERIIEKLNQVVEEKINKEHTKAEVGFKAGDIVRHKIRGDRFKIEEVTENGLIGRKVNNRDPFLFYDPTDLYHA